MSENQKAEPNTQAMRLGVRITDAIRDITDDIVIVSVCGAVLVRVAKRLKWSRGDAIKALFEIWENDAAP